MKTYTVKKLEVGDDLGDTHGLRLTHGVYRDEEGLRSAVCLCYDEPTADLLCYLLDVFDQAYDAKFIRDDEAVDAEAAR
jgi:hypothetical protein